MANAPVSVLDVARYVLRKAGPMTTMKLQKLVYYAQAWSLAWEGEPLFPEAIEAWKHGPVVRMLFEQHRGWRQISDLDAGPENALGPVQRETIDAVLERYGGLQAELLSELTHAEDPWRDARRHAGTAPIIQQDALRTYYQKVLLELVAERSEEPADEPDSHLFWLKTLLSQVDSANRHDEWDVGAPQGREVW